MPRFDVNNVKTQWGYLLHDLKHLILPGLLLGLIIPFVVHFIVKAPSLIPVLPTEWWLKGTLKVGYFTWCIFWCGFALQGPEDKDTRHDVKNDGPFVGTLELSVFLLVSSVIMGLILGIQFWFIALLLPFQLAVFVLPNFGSLGRDGVLPLVHILLIFFGMWLAAFTEKTQATAVFNSLKALWITLIH
jgi:hypothetical protein